MKHTIIDVPQGEPDWFAARLGRVTGSRADVLMAAGKGNSESTQRVNYRYELAEQRITGMLPPPGFINDAMKWGTEHEPFARMAYEGLAGFDVQKTGFIRCDDIMAGCSLDGHVGSMEGIVEIKCPMLKTHVGYLKDGGLPAEYKWQVIHNLLVTGAKWCDFVSYRPGFMLFVVRAYAEHLPLSEYHTALNKFLAEVDECQSEILRFAA